MGTGVGEAMLIGAAVGATAGGAGAAIQGGDPLQGALMGGAMGGIGGGLGAGFGAAGGTAGGSAGAGAGGAAGGASAGSATAALSPTVTSLAAAPTAGTFGGLSAAPTAGTFGGLSAAPAGGTFGALAAPTSGALGGSSGIVGALPVSSALPSAAATAPVTNVLGYAAGAPGYLSNTQLGMIGGTSLLGGMMGAERNQFGIPGGAGDYDGPLSKLKYDPDKFTASEPTYAPGSVYTPQYKTYAAEGGIMRLARGGNIDDQNGMDEPYYMSAGGGTPAALAPAGLEQLMGVKGKGQSLEEMKESAALQGLTPRAYMDIYGEGIKAQQQMAKGGISSLGGYSDGGRMLKGPGDGMSDSIPGVIGGRQPARLADGEFVVPADVVSHIGNGSTDAGAKQLYSMMDKVRKARTGKKAQGKEINPRKYMPA
jgi:hypothetical protein